MSIGASVYSETLEWSKSRPQWQRDALRRLAGSPITEADLEAIELLCLKEYGLTVDENADLQAQPISEEHIPTDSSSHRPLKLLSITQPKNVNQLTPESRLDFAPDGLTIVYGHNGSGKSGYIRILKKVCQARDGGVRLFPNIFCEDDGQPASATITMRSVDGDSSVAWRDTATSTPVEHQICIFDSNCAEFYLTKENEIAYRPFGLDLFDRLAEACDLTKTRLEERRKSLEARTSPPPDAVRTWMEGESLWPISHRSETDKYLPYSVFSDTHEASLADLRQQTVENDPVRKAARLRAIHDQLSRARKFISEVHELLGEDPIKDIGRCVEDIRAIQSAEETLSANAFSGLLPGTGGPVWRALWQSANAFSHQIEESAAIDAQPVCVLCQQPLGTEAQERFRAFQEYTTRELQKQLKPQIDKLQGYIQRITSMKAPADVSDLSQTINAVSEDLFRRFDHLVSNLSAHCADVNTSLGTMSVPTAPTLDLGLLAAIDSYSKEIWQQVQALTEGTNLQVFRGQYLRIAELDARRWISENLSSIKSDIERLKARNRVEASMAATTTTGISKKSNELTERFVSEKLQAAILKELSELGGDRIKVRLRARSVKGSVYHSIDFANRKRQGIPVASVLSEGEFRTVALAAFLAEVAQGSECSSLVFDDPVCSLDHVFSESVVKRIARASVTHQVIVFTHDLMLLHRLIEITTDLGCKVVEVRRGNVFAGHVSENAPWDILKVKQRVHELRGRLEKTRKLYENDDPSYEENGRHWYGCLREVWELTIEELVLNGVVRRYHPEVQTLRLKKVDVSPRDYEIVESGMGKSSRWLRGHVKPLFDATPFPCPTTLEADLQELSEFIAEISKRRQ